MAGYAVTRNALSAEQCKTLAPKVRDHRRIAVPAAVGALLGGKTEVPCKAARGPVRAHADRYADGSLVPDEVAVVYLAVSSRCFVAFLRSPRRRRQARSSGRRA